MDQILERELKLDPDPGFALPPLDGEALETRTFTSTYYDTPPRSLAHAGITLRRRLEHGVSRWQLKLPRDEGRAELEELGGPAGPPDPLRALLLAHLRHGPLEAVATLRTRRSGVRVAEHGRPLADVTLDEVDVIDGQRASSAFVELEVELVEGDDDDLARLGKLLRHAGARRSDGRAKLMRVLDLPPEAKPGRDAPAIVHLRALLAAQLSAIERHDPGVRLGDDPEDVHKARVATRRARALLRATRPLLGDGFGDLEEELKWLASLLGDVRDLDVLLDRLCADAGALGPDDAPAAGAILASFVADRERAREALLAGLADDRYLRLLERFAERIRLLPELEADGGIRAIAAEELRKLRRDAKRLGADPEDERLHDLRKRAKKARYAGELAALAGKKPVARYVDALKDVQDAIGEHQDAVVAEERIRAVARRTSEFAAGRLVERQRARRAAARRAYPALLERALDRGRDAFG